MSKNALFNLLIPFIFVGCGVGGGKKIPQKIEIRYDKEVEINYGANVQFRTFVTYTNGKEKDIIEVLQLFISTSLAK